MDKKVHRIPVKEATDIILDKVVDYGVEEVNLIESIGRVLAEDVFADRDFPPFNRVCMDGICIRRKDFKSGIRRFAITGVLGAGESPTVSIGEGECLEIMTGAMLPSSADCVIRYEDVHVSDGVAKIEIDQLPQGFNIHDQGVDNKNGQKLIPRNRMIDFAEINVLATVGYDKVKVKRQPRALIISTGNELVSIEKEPLPHQIRRSNAFGIEALIQPFTSNVKSIHIDDNQREMESILKEEMKLTDVLILSGGVSMGKFDYVPNALENMGVKKLFHGVLQKPGKPFWFGEKNDKRIFALPGNPVSSMVCTRRYIIPYLRHCAELETIQYHQGVLLHDILFKPTLQRFMEVYVSTNHSGIMQVDPLPGNGSGDFTKLLQANALVELPADLSVFKAGEVVSFIKL